MVTATAFVLAAALGSVIRLAARETLPPVAGLPVGTLAVNLTGAFALGLVVGWSPPVVTVLATGGLGAFTTFSTLSSELVTGWEWERRTAIAYLVATILGGVGSAWLGLQVGG